MADDAPALAPLSAAMMPYASPPPTTADPILPDMDTIPRPGSTWREDLRLFFFTWAAGFVFFMIFLA